MLSNNDIVEIVVSQRHSATGQPILNVYHYQAREVTGSWTDPDNFNDIAAEVYIGSQAVVGPLQSVEIVYDSANFLNLTNGLDIGLYVPETALQGTVASNSEPLQVALSVRLARTNRATRNGSKRYGGIADTVITSPQGANLVGDSRILALQDWLTAPIEVVAGGGDSCTLYPIILRKTLAGVPPTVFSEVAAAIYRGAGSQNSRKDLL